MSVSEVLRRITAALDHSGIAYMVTGSFASSHHGVPRATMDIDIVIEASPQQLRSFAAMLPADAFYVDVGAAIEAHSRQSMFNVLDLISGWKIDLILRKHRPFSLEEFRRRQPAEFQGIPLFVASAEDVVIAKLEWAQLGQSQRQVQDVASILKLRWQDLDRSYIERWISDLSLQAEWSKARSIAGVSENS
jgi:hypothetical protein